MDGAVKLVNAEHAFAVAEYAPTVRQRNFGRRLDIGLGEARAEAQRNTGVQNGAWIDERRILRQITCEVNLAVVGAAGGKVDVFNGQYSVIGRNTALDSVSCAPAIAGPFRRRIGGAPGAVEGDVRFVAADVGAALDRRPGTIIGIRP